MTFSSSMLSVSGCGHKVSPEEKRREGGGVSTSDDLVLRNMFATRRTSRQLPAAAEQLYRSYIETANTFKSYNFKEYFIRQADRKFKTGFPFGASDSEQQTYLSSMQQELNSLKRAAIVNALYEAPKLVVEVCCFCLLAPPVWRS